ncbi:MAG: hypothetical protein R6W93_07435, partial [Candidatus Limnocylindrales bacterium]
MAAFIAGGLAAGVGIAIGELMAGLIVGAPSLVIAIGDTVIENQPPGAKELMVELFGSDNKLALNVGIVATSILLAGVLGVTGRRSWNVPVLGFGVAGAVGLLAALSRPLVEPLWAVVTVVTAVIMALAALRLMLATTRPAWAGSTLPAATSDGSAAGAAMPDWDRRRFLQISGGLAVGAVVLGTVGRNLLANQPGGAAADAQLPTVIAPSVELPAGAALEVE